MRNNKSLVQRLPENRESIFNVLSYLNVTLCPSVWENACLSKMVVRKTKEDRSVRETKPVVLAVKQKESLSHVNYREFTYLLIYYYCIIVFHCYTIIPK